jgi:hypothetical protein
MSIAACHGYLAVPQEVLDRHQTDAWSLRRIEQATGVRRETASAYLKTAGVAVCLPGWGRRASAKPAIGVTTDSGLPKPANEYQVTTDSGEPPGSPGPPNRPKPSPSFCEAYRELIAQELSKGRNAMAIWQDLVSYHGFRAGYQTVKRFVRKLRGSEREPVGIVHTAPGEEFNEPLGGLSISGEVTSRVTIFSF